MSLETAIFDQLVDIVVQISNTESIILFGSHARGDAAVESDIDLPVIDRQPFSPSHRWQGELVRLYLALRKVPVAADVLLYSHEEFEHRETSLNHVIGRAYREGRVLHRGL